jgi:hypothetical protein
VLTRKQEKIYARKWLRDCQVDGWMEDLLTGEVYTCDGKVFNSIISFAISECMAYPIAENWYVLSIINE